MKLSNINPADIAPADLPAGTVKLFGADVDIYPFGLSDIISLSNRKPILIDAFIAAGKDKPAFIARSILSMDKETINWVLSVALGVTQDELKKYPVLTAGQQLQIIIRAIQVSVPKDEWGKLKAEMTKTLTEHLGLAKTASQPDESGQN